jgi:hypothetical protein
VIAIDKWAGLVTNASPYAIPPGSGVTQVNLQVLAPGKVSVRPGMTSVTFTSHTGSTQSIVSMFRYPRSSEAIVYQNSAGQIIVGVNPA